MKSNPKFLLSAVAASFLSAGALPAQSVIVNGSFETVTAGDIANWTQLLDATSQLASVYSSGSPYGDHVLALNATGTLPGGNATQDFTTILGFQYLVEFAYAQFGGAPNEQMLTVSINTFSAPAPDQFFFTDSSPATDLATGWKRASFIFTSLTGSSGITFADTGTTGAATSDLLIDDVSITVVPEPAACSFAALACLAAVVRRRRSPVHG